MPKLINFSLIKNPVNWIIVILMVVIAGIALDLLLCWSCNSSAPTS